MANIHGMLNRAQIEAVGALPSASVDKPKGRIVYLTTDDRYYISDGSNWIKLMPDVTTTKGDLTSFSTVPARLGVGSNGQVLTADSAETTGLKWATNPSAPDQSYEINNLTLSVTANSGSSHALVISVKSKAGSDPSVGDPVKVGFRNSTLSSGSYNQRTISAALSITIPSGSTLGHADAYAHYFYVYLIDNAGTPEIAVSTSYYEDHSIVSTTAISTSADSNSVIYSTTARTNVPIRLIGRMLSTQTTAGTWDAVPSEIKLWPFERIPIIAVFASDNGNAIDGTIRFIDYEDKQIDSHNCVVTSGLTPKNTTTSGAGWKFTSPITTKFRITGQISLDASLTATTIISLRIYKNGTAIRRKETEVQANSNQIWYLDVHDVVSVSAGDYIEIGASQNEGSSRNMYTSVVDNAFLLEEII